MPPPGREAANVYGCRCMSAEWSGFELMPTVLLAPMWVEGYDKIMYQKGMVTAENSTEMALVPAAIKWFSGSGSYFTA